MNNHHTHDRTHGDTGRLASQVSVDSSDRDGTATPRGAQGVTRRPTRHRPRRRRAIAVVTLAMAALGSTALVGSPAHAAPSQYGAGWLHRALDGTVTSASTQAKKPAVKRMDAGRYRVVFKDITGAFGIPDVSTGPGPIRRTCVAAAPSLVNAGVAVDIACTDPDGAFVDTDFTASYTSIPGAREGWAIVPQTPVSGEDVEHTIVNAYNVNGKTVTDEHWDTGVHTVRFATLASWEIGSMTVTSMVPGRHCRAGQFLPELPNTMRVDVTCFDKFGVRSDAGTTGDPEFAVHWTYLRPSIPVDGFHTTNAMVNGGDPFTEWQPVAMVWSDAPHKVRWQHPKEGVFRFRYRNDPGAPSFVSVTPQMSMIDIFCGATTSTKNGIGVATVVCRDAESTRVDPNLLLITRATQDV